MEDGVNAKDIRSSVIEVLRAIHISHVEKSLYELEVIKEISVEDSGRVNIVFVPPSELCPVGINLAFEIRRRVKRVDGVNGVNLRVRELHQGGPSIVQFDD